MNKISENSTALPIYAANLVGSVTSPYFDASKYRRFFAAVQSAAAPGAGKQVFVKLVQAKDAAGTAVKDLVANVGGGATLLFAEVDGTAEMLDTANGYGFVAAVISSDNSTALAGAGMLFADHMRYSA